jgi:transposase
MQVAAVGLDLAKTIFHVHGVTEAGEVAFNRPLRRSQVLGFFDRLAPCLVASKPARRATTGRVSCRSRVTPSG